MYVAETVWLGFTVLDNKTRPLLALRVQPPRLVTFCSTEKVVMLAHDAAYAKVLFDCSAV